MDEKRPRGRPFPKGNPGRKRGSKNKASLLAVSLAGATGEAILRKAIEMAMSGNVAMMKFLLDRKRWSRLSEQNFRIDKWSVCRG